VKKEIKKRGTVKDDKKNIRKDKLKRKKMVRETKTREYCCAAGFALLNLPKGKSLGRSKPETNSYAQAVATHCVGFLLYPSSAELPYAK
jgi:hypothetical protein